MAGKKRSAAPEDEKLRWLTDKGIDVEKSVEEIATLLFTRCALNWLPDRFKHSVLGHIVGEVTKAKASADKSKNKAGADDVAKISGRVTRSRAKQGPQKAVAVTSTRKRQTGAVKQEGDGDVGAPPDKSASADGAEPASSAMDDGAADNNAEPPAGSAAGDGGVVAQGKPDPAAKNAAGGKASSIDEIRAGAEEDEGGGKRKPVDTTRAAAGGEVNDEEGDTSKIKEAVEQPGFKDLSGMDEILEMLWMDVKVAIDHPQALKTVGERPVKGILLHGPPGCGKTTVARALAKEANVPYHETSAAELVGSFLGTSEAKIRDLFAKAYKTAPSIVFIDEIDGIASKRGTSSLNTEKRMVTQLMACMDTNSPEYVLVIGATNTPDDIDPALRRNGRFDREILIPVPDETARGQILSTLMRNRNLDGSFHIENIARLTSGFVCSDLKALVQQAAHIAIKRIFDDRKAGLSKEGSAEAQSVVWWDHNDGCDLHSTVIPSQEALKMVQPSIKREGFSTIPMVTWEDVGGLDSLREQFELEIVNRIKYPKLYEELGIDLDSGILLHGPPGCGKTLLAMAVSGEAGANFIHIKGAELLNKYCGESEKAVRALFSRARTCTPCIIFFDEVDALAAKRDGQGEDRYPARVLNQLLAELDGGAQRRGVYVIGATNRLEAMDPAVLRPGRFGKHLLVPLPGPKERESILRALCRKKPLDADVDLAAIAQSKTCENLSGADLASLMHEAAMVVLKDKRPSVQSDSSENSSKITMRHLQTALTKIRLVYSSAFTSSS
uniref:AAA+ ATPase domain-containing protein n=1 Tax=Kalanchoe fedtschenkoi TaxID=63787 RepID=A0A7N0TP70_KALFE